MSLDVQSYPGGIALWGAVPPVYDTTQQPLDRGIHVHARNGSARRKAIDATFRAVRLVGGVAEFPRDGFSISELDAIYYMVTSVFGFEMKYVECTYCGYPHLDKDWFSVHAHRRHLCAGCGKNFRDADTAIGNPICAVRGVLSPRRSICKPATRTIELTQAEFPGGIQIWGSNPAIVWTGRQSEEEGIHVHAFKHDDEDPFLDDTYARVTIDGITLDPSMVRILMAQRALPHIAGRVTAPQCPRCQEIHFSTGESAFTPSTEHLCVKCERPFPSQGRLRKTIGNPLVRMLDKLVSKAPRPPQKNDIGLLPETL